VTRMAGSGFRRSLQGRGAVGAAWRAAAAAGPQAWWARAAGRLSLAGSDTVSSESGLKATEGRRGLVPGDRAHAGAGAAIMMTL
jgi:hypothetical protein